MKRQMILFVLAIFLTSCNANLRSIFVTERGSEELSHLVSVYNSKGERVFAREFDDITNLMYINKEVITITDTYAIGQRNVYYISEYNGEFVVYDTPIATNGKLVACVEHLGGTRYEISFYEMFTKELTQTVLLEDGEEVMLNMPGYFVVRNAHMDNHFLYLTYTKENGFEYTRTILIE